MRAFAHLLAYARTLARSYSIIAIYISPLTASVVITAILFGRQISDLYKNSVLADFLDVAPGNTYLLTFAEGEALAFFRHNDSSYLSAVKIDFNITYKTEPSAVTYVYNFLFLKLVDCTKSHNKKISRRINVGIILLPKILILKYIPDIYFVPQLSRARR